jgi:hypothetical protein
MLAIAVADLARWSPSKVSGRHALLAALSSVSVTALVAALGGYRPWTVAWIELGIAATVTGWVLLEQSKTSRRPGFQLAWVGGAIIVASSLSSLAAPISGPLRDWYVHLRFSFVGRVSVDESLLGLASLLIAAGLSAMLLAAG